MKFMSRGKFLGPDRVLRPPSGRLEAALGRPRRRAGGGLGGLGRSDGVPNGLGAGSGDSMIQKRKVFSW